MKGAERERQRKTEKDREKERERKREPLGDGVERGSVSFVSIYSSHPDVHRLASDLI